MPIRIKPTEPEVKFTELHLKNADNGDIQLIASMGSFDAEILRIVADGRIRIKAHFQQVLSEINKMGFRVVDNHVEFEY